MNHLYLHGFASGPSSRKAVEVGRALERLGVALDVPDLNLPSFERLTLTAMVAEAERRLRPPAFLWGSSLGGYLAALLAARHPGSVERLVLMAPAVDFPEQYPARVADAQETWRRGGTVPVFHHAAQRELPLSGDLLADCPGWPVRPHVTCPALVFAARRDAIIPLQTIERWASEQPKAELVVLDDVHELTASLPVILERGLAFATGSRLRRHFPGRIV